MTKIFYDHLIVFEEVLTELDSYELEPEERSELVILIEENLHHTVLDVILTNLPKEQHEVFLAEFYQTPHSKKLLVFLETHAGPDISDKISQAVAKAKKEILSEIKNSHSRS